MNGEGASSITFERVSKLYGDVAAARDVASQPAFEVVKKQVRGGLAADVQGLAVAGADPFLRSFG